MFMFMLNVMMHSNFVNVLTHKVLHKLPQMDQMIRLNGSFIEKAKSAKSNHQNFPKRINNQKVPISFRSPVIRRPIYGFLVKRITEANKRMDGPSLHKVVSN